MSLLVLLRRWLRAGAVYGLRGSVGRPTLLTGGASAARAVGTVTAACRIGGRIIRV